MREAKRFFDPALTPTTEGLQTAQLWSPSVQSLQKLKLKALGTKWPPRMYGWSLSVPPCPGGIRKDIQGIENT